MQKKKKNVFIVLYPPNNLYLTPVLTKHYVRQHATSCPFVVAAYTIRDASSQTPTSFPRVWSHKDQSRTVFSHTCTYLLHGAESFLRS